MNPFVPLIVHSLYDVHKKSIMERTGLTETGKYLISLKSGIRDRTLKVFWVI
jgi:hypothetical protein